MKNRIIIPISSGGGKSVFLSIPATWEKDMIVSRFYEEVKDVFRGKSPKEKIELKKSWIRDLRNEGISPEIIKYAEVAADRAINQ